MSLPLALPISSLVVLPMGLLMLVLAGRVAVLRRQHKIGVGERGNKQLAKAIGAHGNAVDNIPLALLLFMLAELQGANAVLLSICGAVFVVARCMNAFGVNRHVGLSFSRFYGIILTWLILLILLLINLWLNLA